MNIKLVREPKQIENWLGIKMKNKNKLRDQKIYFTEIK